ncbi:MAG: hypothetical protein R3C61_08435 [Bacteroidia bacterium]
MVNRFLLLFFWFAVFSAIIDTASGQSLRLTLPAKGIDTLQTIQVGTFVRIQPGKPSPVAEIPDILPDYAKENPSGHTWLCRAELRIENQLPVGIWVKAGDAGGIVNSTGNNLHLKLKLLRF